MSRIKNNKVEAYMDSEKVLIVKNHEVLHREILDLLSDYLTDEVMEYIESHPPEYLGADDVLWIDTAILEVTGTQINCRFILVDRLYENFSFVRAYHACCPTNLDSYRKQGLLVLDPRKTNEFVHSLFCDEYGVMPDVVDAAIQKQKLATRENRIYFELDEEWLVKYCKDYLLFGSEYVLSIAGEITRTLNNGIDYQSHLRLRGIPTIIECNVPLNCIDESDINELSGVILNGIFERLFRVKDELSFAFEITETLKPNNIVRFIHIDPSKIQEQ